LTDELGLTTIVTLYQAGNGIYDLFDKVLVLDEGEQVFYGPREHARPFMESLGFICNDAANVADFLTGVTVPNERRVREGYENQFPRNAVDLRAAFEKSHLKPQMDKQLDFASTGEAATWTTQFKAAVELDKAKSLSKKSPLTASFLTQVRACVTRQYQIIWGDKVSTETSSLLQHHTLNNPPRPRF
jgi:ABC-type multidrug transport system ATPase subunit